MRSAQATGSSSAADSAGVRAASELRSRASSRLRAAVLMRASLAGAPWHRGVGELLAGTGPVDQLALLHEDDIGGPLEVAPLTFRWRTEEAQQPFKLPCGNGSG